LEKGEGLFTNAGGEVAAAGAQPEQPALEQAAGFTLGGLQELKLLTLFAKHFHVEVGVGQEIKRRTHVIRIFPNEESALRPSSALRRS
jgi:hypothetical protein